jgi:uncharacterized membrane-anchored protein
MHATLRLMALVVILASPLARAADGEPAAATTGTADSVTPAQQHVRDVLKSLHWVKGPAQAEVGSNATLAVPDGYVFLDAKDTKTFQELMENVANGHEYLLAPEDLHWFALFEYEDTGYVKDDEKIDADALLKSLRESTEAGNEERRRRGWSEMHVKGWRVQPAYNADTKRLEWAIDGESNGQVSTNLFTKVLGRHGVTSVVLVTEPATLAQDAPAFRDAIKGFDYHAGERYAEFKAGDRVAEYGLAGLIAGGGVAVAAKAGLFKGLWKLLVAGGAALVAGARGLVKKFRGDAA